MENSTKKQGNATVAFVAKWWKVIIAAFAVGLVASTVTAFLIKPMFKSTAVFFPTSSNRLSKAILGDRYTYDFLDYGDEEDCEYAMQILNSQTMRDTVCNHFNLTTHYAIDENDAHRLYKLQKIYHSNVTVKRTDNLAVEVSVMDSDPQWAADIANFIVDYYDTLSRSVQRERAHNAFQLMSETQKVLSADIIILQDSLNKTPNRSLALTQLLTAKCAEEANIETYMSVTHTDMTTPLCQKFMLDRATPADKKAYPKRLAIILAGSLGALLICIAVLIVLEYVKNEELRIKE
jgi:uncharacterized protein involved in exopolysaccharide biosynthesis